MRILIVDNNIDPDCWGAADLRRFATLVPGATVHVRRAPHDDLPRDIKGYDRVVVSGSKTSCLEEAPWITRLDEMIQSCLNEGKPYLGVCYGHQALVRTLAGKTSVRRGTTPEFGWTKIETLAPSPLFQGLPKNFHSFSSHYEEAAILPPGMKLLARSQGCEIQACQLGDRPVFGIQFHPEKTLEEGAKTISNKRKNGEEHVLVNPDAGSKLYDAKVGETLFKNFFNA